MSKKLDDKGITGEYFKDHIWIISDKLIIYGQQLKQLKEIFKSMLKAIEMSMIAAGSIVSMNNLISERLQKYRPDSELAEMIPAASKSLKRYESDRLERWTNFLNIVFPTYEMVYEKKMQSIKNYLKIFESDDKDRLVAIKKLKSKRSSRNKDKDQERDETADKYFDLRTAREDCLRKLMIDENIVYASLLELNTLLLKNDLFVTDKYTLREIRPSIQTYDHILMNINSIPPECDYVIKNPELFLESNRNSSLTTNGIMYSRPNSRYILDYFKFKSLPPFISHPKITIFQYISIDTNEIDLVHGDLIICYTDVCDGWQFGINISTERSGWFPVSFTVDSTNVEDVTRMNSFLDRIQKFGDNHSAIKD